jgi:hypothetical protein
MKNRKWFITGAFVLSIAAVFAFRTPDRKLINNAAKPGACSTLVADCNGGQQICEADNVPLVYSDGTSCFDAAKRH